SLLHHTTSSCNIRRSQKLDSTPQVDRSHSQRATIAILICTLAYIVISIMESSSDQFVQNTSNEFKVGDRVRLLVNFDCLDNKKAKMLPKDTTGNCLEIIGDKCKVMFEGLKECQLVYKYYLEILEENKTTQEDSSVECSTPPTFESIDEDIDPSELVKGDIFYNSLRNKRYMFIGIDSSGYADCVNMKSGKLHCLHADSVQLVDKF
ncbi:MAG: hypothetical protein MHMPM18_002030, partial [Marteilia pararefringens]